MSVKIKSPIPPWAKGATNDYTVFGALLPTRDGRQTGNSVVTRVTVTENGVRIMVATEAGNIVGPLTLREVEELYYRPKFYSPFHEFPGKSGAAWNDFIFEEESQAKAAMDYDPVPDVSYGFPDGNASEVRVMGTDGQPHWMPLSEIVEYIQENTPPIATNNKYSGWGDTSDLIIGEGPMDKGAPITEYPETMTKDIPSGIYWDMKDGMFKSQISGQIQTDKFHSNWGWKKTMFPTKPYEK